MTTTTPPDSLGFTTSCRAGVLRVELHGDLDHDSADPLLSAVTEELAGRPGLSDLHLDCAGLGTIDSTGLSVLIMIRRRASEAGVQLHLDERGPALERMLAVTGTLRPLTETLTSDGTPAATAAARELTPPVGGAASQQSRPSAPDGPA
ncbi:STAS domain-containing protein [uncultured Streptomyces sp.]|uniref:STAS domain-containing protein n=1 Tax=uncultured Streptomyces sp. TaxID=174707 RepID=UPI0026106590|nr:STAS domain-containing protein [uncultured Streptomyces sp.]